MVLQTLLMLHLTGMMLLAAGVGGSIACTAAARRSSSPHVIHELLQVATRFVRRLVMPGSYLLLFTGIWLVGGSQGRYSMTDPWIGGAVAAWLALVAVVFRLLAPSGRAARQLAHELAAEGAAVSEELGVLVRSGRFASVLATGLLMLMITFMVFKPG